MRRHVIFVGTLVIVAGCDLASLTSNTSVPSATNASPSAKVKVARVGRGPIRKVSEQPGQIVALESAPIFPKVSGYTKKVHVNIGDRVKQGQLLVEIDVPELIAERDQKQALIAQALAEKAQGEASVAVAQASLSGAEARIRESEAGLKRTAADLARWQSEFNRTEQLVRESAVSASLLDEVRSKRMAAESTRDEVLATVKSSEAALVESRAELEKARADVLAAESRVEVARLDHLRVSKLVEYTRVTSPLEGIVTDRKIDSGHLTSTAASIRPILEISRSDQVTVRFAIPEAFGPLVTTGANASVRIPALGSGTISAKVSRTGWKIDPATRTLAAEIDLTSQGEKLRPGLYAKVAVSVAEVNDALRIPLTAVLRDGTRTSCMKVAGGKVQRTEITLGLDDGTLVEVKAGLNVGDDFVETTPGALVNGQDVTIEGK